MINSSDPFTIFEQWFQEAKNNHYVCNPTIMTLATCTKSGIPSARNVYLKKYSRKGFVFLTNLTSKKAIELKSNPNAALCFYWEQLKKQIRVEGTVKKYQKKKLTYIFSISQDQNKLPLGHQNNRLFSIMKTI